MRLFESARTRLTAWYLIIIAFISLSFSAILYRDVSWKLEQGFQLAEYRLRGLPVPREKAKLLLEDELEKAKRSVLLRLLFINGIILGVAGIGGYFLAGYTLYPIKVVMDEQKRFVADASHELRTPLTSMKTEIEVSLRDKKLGLADTKKLLKSNLQEVDKMRDLANYLLSLSRYETNGRDLPLEKVDLAELVKKAIDKNRALSKKKNITVKEKLEKVSIRGNSGSLIELFSILIDNALKYSQKGKTVEVLTKKGNRFAKIEIKDQGVGIKKEDLPHIFNRFYRADTSRGKDVADGYGLGLSIAKSIVNFHKGEIKVESKPNKGSTFLVVLPK